MKKLINFLAIVFIIFLSGCAKYTDITPKGQNLLNRVSDLDLLMNVDYSGQPFFFNKETLLIDDNYLFGVNVPNTISSNVVTMDKVLLTYDESADRGELTPIDPQYEGLYKIISTVTNIVLANADNASGDVQLKKQLKAEAYIIRAYLHYLLVNIYAKAYDPGTAATDGGIPYVKELNFEKSNSKLTVKEVYYNILSDLESAMALDALPDQPKNSMRAGKGFAYAVKAKVLMSMRDYSGALEAVNSALTFNSTIEDHRPLLSLPMASRVLSRSGLTASDNLFYALYNNSDPTLYAPTYEILNNYYEPGNIIRDSTNTYNYVFGIYIVGLPNIPLWYQVKYEANSAGMTTSDLIMMKAECLIRTNKVNEGMDEVNKIRIRRIDPAIYAPLSATSVTQAMTYLQRTSRIEFLFTWRNFVDLKRWNREGTYPVAVERTINGTTYTLQANSKLWIFPFPQSATQFNETLTQNY